ncbi:cation diffusion facilitator family transporter [Rhodococcus aerolatus]
MGAGHGHGHGHGAHAAGRTGRLLVALGILVVFLVLEVVVGLLSGSLALLSDAGHMLTDVAAMTMALVALELGRRGSAQAARTFGWHRAEVLTAVVNAALLLGVGGFVVVEAVRRLGDPPEVPGLPLVLTALAGLAANVAVALLLRAHAADSLAVRGAYLEVLADAVGSVGVLVAGVLVAGPGWAWADPVVAVGIAALIVPRAIGLGRSGLRILVQAAPAHVDLDAVRADLLAVDGVQDVHDLHVWTLTTGKDVATAHLTSEAEPAGVLTRSRDVLAAHGLAHATVQVEPREHTGRCAETDW